MAEQVAGLAEHCENANKERLEEDGLVWFVEAMRGGDRKARKKLQEGLCWLVYHYARNLEGEFRPHMFGPVFGAMTLAVDRLAENKELNIEKYVEDEIRRTLREEYNFNAGNLAPPSSTVHFRKAARKPRPRRLRRCSLSAKTRRRRGSCRERDRLIRETDLKLDITGDDDEKLEVYELLYQGYSYARIAAAIGSTTYRVRRIIEDMHLRAVDLGYVVPAKLKIASS